MNTWMTMLVAMGLTAAVAGDATAAGRDVAPVGTCGTATLRDVEVLTGREPMPSIATVREKRRRGGRDGFVFVTPPERQTRRYLVTIEMGDMTWTGESSGNAFWNYDPTQLVINDAIHACVTKDTLRLRRPDGRDYKSTIVRAVRSRHAASFETALR